MLLWLYVLVDVMEFLVFELKREQQQQKTSRTSREDTKGALYLQRPPSLC